MASRHDSEIRELLEAGLSRSAIARRLGINRSTVTLAARRLGFQPPIDHKSPFDWDAIREWYEAGHSGAECRRRFGCSLGSWQAAIARGDIVPRPAPQAAVNDTQNAVAALLEEGLSQSEIASRLGRSKATVAYHARRLGHKADTRFGRRYDWPEVQRAHDAGLSASECCQRFGFCKATWTQAVRRGDIVARSREIPIEQLLVVGRRTRRGHLKARLIKAGLKENRCEECGITEWRGKPLIMQLHHCNGDGSDNRLENIKFLCANCHSQTETYGGRNGTPPCSR